MSDELKQQTIDTPEFRDLMSVYWRSCGSASAGKAAAALIAHIDAWGARLAGEAVQPKQLIDAVSIMLWLYRRLPQAYGRPPFVEQPIAALATIVGIEVDEHLRERGPEHFDKNAQRWHAPGMGEVHYHDHSMMIECMREIDHPEQDYVADEALAKWVCDTLNRAGSPFHDKERPCGS